MRNVLRLAVALSAASIFGAALLLACSDDTSVNASTDGGTIPVPDGGGSDSPSAVDAGPDTSPPFDGGFVVSTFDGVLVTELCKTLARCCYGTTMPAEGGADGGTFDTAACQTAYGMIGFEGSNADIQLRDGGNVVLDQVSADSCIKKIQAMTCNLPGSEFKAIRTACFGAYTGTVATGGACKASVECHQGFFCKINDADAGTGACTAIRAANGACGDSDPNRADEACSYRAGGDTGNFCKFGDVATGTLLDAGDWKCTPSLAVGSDCATSLWCDQSLCSDLSTCESPEMYFATSCAAYVK